MKLVKGGFNHGGGWSKIQKEWGECGTVRQASLMGAKRGKSYGREEAASCEIHGRRLPTWHRQCKSSVARVCYVSLVAWQKENRWVGGPGRWSEEEPVLRLGLY